MYDFDDYNDTIDVYMQHTLYEFDKDGNKTHTNTPYSIKRCSLSDLNET